MVLTISANAEEKNGPISVCVVRKLIKFVLKFTPHCFSTTQYTRHERERSSFTHSRLKPIGRNFSSRKSIDIRIEELGSRLRHLYTVVVDAF